MIELDYLLITTAIWVVIKTRNSEAVLLLACFSGSVLIIEFLSVTGIFNKLGSHWFIFYSAWLSIFVLMTHIRQIAILYCTQQLICLLIIWQWDSKYSFFYDYYEYLIAIIYLKQLGCIYGHNHFCNSDQWYSSDFYMAHHRSSQCQT